MLYIADCGLHTVRQATTSGMQIRPLILTARSISLSLFAGVVTTFAGQTAVSGYLDGLATSAKFYCPFGITTDSTNNVYVSDCNNNAIRMIRTTGGIGLR
jgi:hypothetical protein